MSKRKCGNGIGLWIEDHIGLIIKHVLAASRRGGEVKGREGEEREGGLRKRGKGRGEKLEQGRRMAKAGPDHCPL